MKSLIKSFLTLSLIFFVSFSFAQDSDLDDPVTQAQLELIELKGMDKGSMTKSEKKAWKRKKRALTSYINSEQDRRMRENSPFWRFSPYNRYSPFYRGGSVAYSSYNRPIRYNRPVRYSRPVVVVRSSRSNNRCTYPSRRR